MSELINLFPTALLGAMVALTLLLLPLLNDDEPARDDRQRTDKIAVPALSRQRTDTIVVPAISRKDQG